MILSDTSHPAALYHLRKVTRISALIIILLVVVGFFLPTDYRVERRIVINAPSHVVYDDMFKAEYLSKWMFIQGGQVDVFDGALKEGDLVGLSYSETPDVGELILIKLSDRLIRFDVRPKLKNNLVHNEIVLQPNGNSTFVKWTIKGNLSAGLLGPYLAFFANDIAGENFEISLRNLKEQIEDQK